MPTFQTHRGRVLHFGPTDMVVPPLKLCWARLALKALGSPKPPVALQRSPTPKTSGRGHLAYCNQSDGLALWKRGSSPNDLWSAFGVILPFPWRPAHILSWIALWPGSIGSRKSDSLPSFCLVFSVPISPCCQCLGRKIPFWFLASAEMAD